MEYYGLLQKFPVNRPLTEQERADHLPQKKRQATEALFQLSVIRMNSTFLECVDKFFRWKGLLTFIATIPATGPVFVIASMLSEPVQTWNTIISSTASALTFVFFLLVMIGILIGYVWVVRRECFRLTHYPMRFNRKTKMVHVFRLDGSLLSIPWDALYFTLGFNRNPDGYWDVRAHVLDTDQNTVLETFALAYFSPSDFEQQLSQWEFIRRYMEEGPRELVAQVDFPMAVAGQRETFWSGFNVILANFTVAPWLGLLFMPPMALVATARWIAVHTSKIPVWPDAIEQSCKITPKDRYRIEPDAKKTGVFEWRLFPMIAFYAALYFYFRAGF